MRLNCFVTDCNITIEGEERNELIEDVRKHLTAEHPNLEIAPASGQGEQAWRSILKDTIELKREKDQLDQFRSFIDKGNDGVFIIDPKTGQFKDVNQTVCEWLGYDRDTVLEKTIFDFQTTFSGTEKWQEFVRQVREENGVLLDNEITTRDGSTIPVEGSINVVSVDGDEYVVALPRKTNQ